MPGRTRHPFVRLSQPAGESVVAGSVLFCAPTKRLAPRTTARLATTPLSMQMGDAFSPGRIATSWCASKAVLACSLIEG